MSSLKKEFGKLVCSWSGELTEAVNEAHLASARHGIFALVFLWAVLFDSNVKYD